jgi:hypothetical protein
MITTKQVDAAINKNQNMDLVESATYFVDQRNEKQTSILTSLTVRLLLLAQ